METERLDIYDFKVVLAEHEFLNLSKIADVSGFSIECVLNLVIERGIIKLLTMCSRKET